MPKIRPEHEHGIRTKYETDWDRVGVMMKLNAQFLESYFGYARQQITINEGDECVEHNVHDELSEFGR